MPQLNPDPWLSILGTTWLMYIILQSKIKSHTSTNPTTNNPEKKLKKPWPWPWT
uniref:ATP synthase complex subunit 8 n=1 Tax=Ranacephala hogei TaxID=241399 RepID=A0A343LPV1_9SAUR|nr:ATP synthase F0 subunit 8 [Mesoclemmys hogei]ATQ37390.1 ATP synthase F0 subunit 8 [Mesoclemmys hogei]